MSFMVTFILYVNVLIDGSGRPRLTDFGLAAVPGDADLQLSTMTMTRNLDSRWRAPEVIGIERDPERPTFKSDVYSFGGVMFFIISGDVPWKEKKHSHQISIELSNRAGHRRPNNILDDHWKFIQKCWSWNPQNRPVAAEATGRKNIVIFGETGASKRSLVNLLAGKELIAPEDLGDVQRCTLRWQGYPIGFDGDLYKVFDTIGLEEPQLGIKEYLESVENAYKLVKELDKQGGIDLLLFCVRAGRVTATLQSNYWLFNEFLCEKKVPIVLAITHLEREQRMEDWWVRNQSTFDKYQIQVAGHACITTENRLDGRHRDLYEESRVKIRNLVKKITADGQKQSWIGGDSLFVSLMRRSKELISGSSNVRRRDLVPHLTKRCGVSREVAKQLADMIKQE
ncbi:kinase-like domain-containing protein [Suillus paluster]|uniref:kinase-like domain-containing protein n=1 Tax=Suillus paluster TaxID=48578 RepID=UPI001B85EBB7|nr:kinase-like domain-containing protein [Suillus paluster]KAG1745332.1 kinase-like domain-containing protein [Suillus paluster]